LELKVALKMNGSLEVNSKEKITPRDYLLLAVYHRHYILVRSGQKHAGTNVGSFFVLKGTTTDMYT
jgi:hypothetical protein